MSHMCWKSIWAFEHFIYFTAWPSLLATLLLTLKTKQNKPDISHGRLHKMRRKIVRVGSIHEKCTIANCTWNLEKCISTDRRRATLHQFSSKKMSEWWIVAFVLVIQIFVIYVGLSGGDSRRIGRRQKGFSFAMLTIAGQSSKQMENKLYFFLFVSFFSIVASSLVLYIVHFKVTQFYIKTYCAATQRTNMRAFWMFRMNT